MHQWHHAKSDTPEDLHSPIHGWFIAVVGWFLLKGSEILPEKQYRQIMKTDNTRRRVVLWQLKYHTPLTILMGYVVPMLIGWTSLDFWYGILMPCALLALQWVCAWRVNYRGHKGGKPTNFGGRTEQVLSEGECTHLLHHLLQSHYRIGREGQWDYGARVIEKREKRGWAWHLKGSPEYPLPART